MSASTGVALGENSQSWDGQISVGRAGSATQSAITRGLRTCMQAWL
ncbi:hypothetical protein [Photobacterium angustum]|nr:hypothetical protein [Photobacterium angustum]